MNKKMREIFGVSTFHDRIQNIKEKILRFIQNLFNFF